MNYLNKFQNLVSKGVSNVKNAINSQKNVEKGMINIYGDNSSPIETNTTPLAQPVTQKTTSMSEFLSGKSTQSNDTYISRRKDTKPDADFLKGFSFINGETPVEWDRCNIKIESQIFQCKCIVTGFRLILNPLFKSTSLVASLNSIQVESLFPEGYFSLPIHKIDTCEKIVDKANNYEYSVVVNSKDGRTFELIFKYGQSESFYFCLIGLIQTKTKPTYSSFAIKYNTDNKYEENGWELYNPEKEYARQGVPQLDNTVSKEPNKFFRRTALNEKYSLCESYPKFLITSAHITDEELRNASAFRTKHRIPSLAYYYPKNNGNIWRSSQTKSGLTNSRNAYDEKYLSFISEIGSQKQLIVYDARPMLSAYANRLKGAGFEDKNNYSRTELTFCEIDNIHTARNALKKIYDMLKSPDFRENKKFYSGFESSTWPEFIFGIIKSGIRIATSVKEGYSCLIHCSDGWDRASQLTAFSQLLVDPYFRTLKGYMILIEKDFLSFGHQFQIRNGYYSDKDYKEDQNSPILLQYLDATHQLLVNYPMYFEFNMDFLIFVANNINSGKYGTFLYNHEKDRDAKDARKKTMSIWTEVLHNKEKYINPYYEKKAQEEFFFVPTFSIHKIRFWEEFFLQYTQLNVGLSYHKYITRWNTVDCKESRILSNIQMYNKDRESEKDVINKQKGEIKQLQDCILDLIKSYGINIDNESKITEESKEIIKRITERGSIETIENRKTEETMTQNEEKKDEIVSPIEEKKNEVTVIPQAEEPITKEEEIVSKVEEPGTQAEENKKETETKLD